MRRKFILPKEGLTVVLTAVFLFALCQTSFSQKAEKNSVADDSTGIRYFKPDTINTLFGGRLSENRMVQSAGHLDGRELERSPVSLLTNALQGRMAGLYINQLSGVPKYDNPELLLRGKEPLIVVDGVPRIGLAANDRKIFDVLNINPEQVESVTLLKDALSTAMLGGKGMDGVLMITTRKKSKEGANTNTLSFKAQAGIQSPIGLRQFVSAADYAELYNEALANDGYEPIYTRDQINAYRSQSDPFLYPDVDWNRELFKTNSLISRYTVNAAGSSRLLNYFVSLDYQNQEGLFRESDQNKYPTNINYKRYMLRSNIGIRIDDQLSAFLNILGTIHDYIQPGAGYEAIITGLKNMPNNAYPKLNFDGSLGGNTSYRRNLWGLSTATGYLKDNLQSGYFDVGLKRNMDDVLKGLWVKALLSYNPIYEQRIERTKDFQVFYFPVTGDTATYQRFGNLSNQTNTSNIPERVQQAYTELSAGYDREFGKTAVSGILLANQESIQLNRNLNNFTRGIATRWNVSFSERYNVEVAAAYNGNNYFAPGKQYDFFPAVGASWNLHKEAFLATGFFNQFKARITYGKVGNANPGYYEFRQTYSTGPGYFFGSGATSVNGNRQGDLANPNRVAEKANKLNAGLDLVFSKNRAWITVDYFNNAQYDLLQRQWSNTAVMGQTYPLENIGRNKYYGWETSFGWTDRLTGAFRYYLQGNISSVQSKIVDIGEPAMPFEWMQETGHPVNQVRGYVFEGFFNSSNLGTATIDGYLPIEGDLRYKDLNNDGVIDYRDRTIIGNKKPLLFYGFNLGFEFKGFDVSVLLQGVKNRDIVTTGNYEWEFLNNGRGQAYAHHLDRYTASNADNATYPRLSVGGNRNNQVLSSFWVRNGDYMRFKNFEVGYTFGSSFLSKMKVRSIRLFATGQNLFTLSEYDVADPEVYSVQYPLQRVINGGISINL
ncbi:MAG: SusC/RagA family TonB-linked outer membrane protein [Niabella sp.]